MAASDLDPLAAMYAAVEAVGRGDAGEIELEWGGDDHLGNETRLTITVRREVRQFVASLSSDDRDD